MTTTRLSRRLSIAGLALILAVATAACGPSGLPATPAAADVHDQSPGRSEGRRPEPIDRIEFNKDMRKLWEDHVTWTRLFVVSFLADLPDVDATAGRLLQNQADIGDAIVPFYGDEAGAALTSLLTDHILIAADLVGAAKAGDGDAVAEHRARWDANADDIARFLADANPAWPFETMQDLMHAHLDQTFAEVAARLAGDFEADIAAYEEIHLHILELADVLADGIIEQFPRRFTRP